MSRRRWSIAAALILLAALAFAGWWALRTVPLPVAVVVPGSVAVRVTGPATVQARIPVTLSARLTSTVVSLAVDVGDQVQAGQLLVTLDGRDLAARQAAVARQQESIARQVEAADAAVAKARAELELARSRQARDADLQAKGFVSNASLDGSTSAARAAAAALDSARATSAARRADQAAARHELVFARTQAGYTQLAAPMAAVVVQRLVEPGGTVGPGTPILRLVDPRSLWVTMRVDEALVDRVAVGQPATIRLRSGSTVAGRVERVSLQSDAATRELDVNVAFVAVPPRLALDQEAEVQVEAGREAGLVVPVTALTQDAGGRAGVLQVVEGRTRFVPLRTGPAADGLVLVKQGLSPGDQVAENAAQSRPGLRVRALVR